MVFQFDKKTISVVDSENEIRIRRSTVFYDVADQFFFIYQGHGIQFEFSMVEKRERRNILIKGQPSEYMVQVATLIVEPSLRAGLKKALGSQDLDQKLYETIKGEVSAGMFSLSTWGGDLLSFVPDYQVSFIQSLSDTK